MNENKKELNSNEIENVTGGVGGRRNEPLRDKRIKLRPRIGRPDFKITNMSYGAPCRFPKIDRDIVFNLKGKNENSETEK